MSAGRIALALFAAAWGFFFLLDLHGCAVSKSPARGHMACGDRESCVVPTYRLLQCYRAPDGHRGINTACDGDGEAVMVLVTLAAMFQVGDYISMVVLPRAGRDQLLSAWADARDGCESQGSAGETYHQHTYGAFWQ
jgi:hypothetical protein